MKKSMIMLLSAFMVFIMTGCSMTGFSAYGITETNDTYNIDISAFDALENAGIVSGLESDGISIKANTATTLSGIIACDSSIIKAATLDESAVDYRTPGTYFAVLTFEIDIANLSDAVSFIPQGNLDGTVSVKTTECVKICSTSADINSTSDYESRSAAVLNKINKNAALLSDIATHEHNYVETSRKEASCTKNGSITYTCSICGQTYEEVIDATGHDFVVVETKVLEEGYSELQTSVENLYRKESSTLVSKYSWDGCSNDDCDAIFMASTGSFSFDSHEYVENVAYAEQGLTMGAHAAWHNSEAYKLYKTVEPRTYTKQVCKSCGITQEITVTQAAYTDYDYDDGPIPNNSYFEANGITPPDDGIWWYCPACDEFYEHGADHDQWTTCTCGLKLTYSEMSAHCVEMQNTYEHKMLSNTECKCGATFNTQKELFLHVRNALESGFTHEGAIDWATHSVVYNNYIWWVCKCGEAFATSDEWLAHTRSHYADGNWYDEHGTFSIIPIFEKVYHEAVCTIKEY